jgi:hypothetical protein
MRGVGQKLDVVLATCIHGRDRKYEVVILTLELLGLLTSVVTAIFQIYFTKMIITEEK